ncbi:MAG: ABC transporter ATP-binding protein [Deltaproteobacteria bacterium]|nr:ABC transporter ATP-binding protein [Deltaproteobacteria bacterium]
MTTHAITVERLYKAYPSVQALRDLSLEIEEGEFFGLLGPNGAGKSTLINILAGLVKGDSGSVLVQGHDTVADFRSTRRALGVVPQELVYDPFFTVEEMLRIQGGYFGVSNNGKWIEELLEALGLSDKRGANLRSLSGGMKRRLLIAQALVHKPPIVILDEPTAGVDVEQRHALWAFIQKLNRDGHTILLTTHYLEEAERLCDRIAIIDRGEVKALDNSENLIARGHGKRLILTTRSEIITLPPELEEVVLKAEETTLTIEYRPGENDIQEIWGRLSAAGIEVIDIESSEPSLEDVFMDLVSNRTVDKGHPDSRSKDGSI